MHFMRKDGVETKLLIRAYVLELIELYILLYMCVHVYMANKTWLYSRRLLMLSSQLLEQGQKDV